MLGNRVDFVFKTLAYCEKVLVLLKVHKRYLGE